MIQKLIRRKRDDVSSLGLSVRYQRPPQRSGNLLVAVEGCEPFDSEQQWVLGEVKKRVREVEREVYLRAVEQQVEGQSDEE